MPRASEHRQRVSIQSRNETQSATTGTMTDTWSTLRSRWPAKVMPLIGRELERAQRIDPRITHEVMLRYWRSYRTDLNGGRTRLVYHDIADRAFEIVSPPVDVDERHEQVLVRCKEAA